MERSTRVPWIRILMLSLPLVLLPCAGRGADRVPRAQGLVLHPVVSELRDPVWLTSPPGDPRLFVVEQAGRIRIVRDGRLLPEPFLDITDRVRSGGERGLLSLAFHPDYPRTGFLYVDYTDRGGDTRVERYAVGRDPDHADPASALTLLHIDQPYSNHNGGLVMFGPDGMLWIGMGDGGSAGDPHDNAGNCQSLLGKLLRLDVDHGTPYAIPPDNPYADGVGGRPEIWASGLRNPWRFAFDPPERRLYIADVGQDRWEEIDVVDDSTAGLDFGWRSYEGSHPFRPDTARAETVPPVIEYSHEEGCSVTGGFVYRGAALPEIAGHYLYSDYCSGWLRSFRFVDGLATERREWAVATVGGITSFGMDAAGELYVLSAGGTVYRIERAPAADR
jgi:glucose/arabinose dehydrogenase